ncbi:type I-D CRISPR-associated helicase Cas3' [Halorussus pelagicus]|uniref:type I-D CRISPR-associated helicase Cas3' n=1 Tax=Halorussus pelagicus TaxID=2505977 RepID=UPI000FFBB5B0|nr:type I-D CRISPR-associated helicase Cas3' [Halorussus pelagicus]
MTTLELHGVALKQHDDPYSFDWSPYAHQVELRRLFRERDEFVAVNDSPTGGGKTSSWLAPVLEERLDTVAVYPTNALVRDQYDSIRDIAEEQTDHDVAVLFATAESLRDKRAEYDESSNGGALNEWLKDESRHSDQVLFLTNPDILVMMRRNLYHKNVRGYKDFEVAIVDEFHRAGRKEQNTLRYLLDELYEEENFRVALSKIVFLSATPDDEQERKFERAMRAPYHRATRTGKTERRAFTDALEAGWSAVMPPVSLDVGAAPTFQTADVLLEDDFEETIAFCREGRTVIMLDGIHEVERVFDLLSEELDKCVERIDGFHRENVEEKLESFDVLVSNSAVEVGIDFDVEQILFAGHSKASFLQRLGRLRTDDQRRTARCYVPTGVARTLADHHGRSLSRGELTAVLDEAYDEPRQPETFDARYSAAEALEHLDQRCKSATSDQADDISIEALDRIERHFSVGPDTEFSIADLKRFKQTLDWRALTNMQWYRGDSIQALVWNATENTLQTYDLFYLLRNGKVTFYTESEFPDEIPDEYASEIDRYARYVDGFCVYEGTIETNEEGYGREVCFTGKELGGWLKKEPTDKSREPRVVSGLKVDVGPNGTGSRVQSIDKVNDRLTNRRERTGENGGVLCYPVYGTTKQVKEWYDLGSFFFLYPVKVQGKDAHSLALGTDALYLHCHVLEDDGFGQDSDGDSEYIGL